MGVSASARCAACNTLFRTVTLFDAHRHSRGERGGCSPVSENFQESGVLGPHELTEGGSLDPMAQNTLVTLVDDISGEQADETVEFGLGKSWYEIDLTTKNAAELRDFLEPYTKAGRAIVPAKGGKATTRKPGAPKEGGPAVDSSPVREWARTHGFPDVKDRGRLSKEITDAWVAAGSPGVLGAVAPVPVSQPPSDAEK